MTETDTWRCPRCGDTTTFIGRAGDVAVARQAVLDRHSAGHANGRVNLDGTSRSRRANRRAEAARARKGRGYPATGPIVRGMPPAPDGPAP